MNHGFIAPEYLQLKNNEEYNPSLPLINIKPYSLVN